MFLNFENKFQNVFEFIPSKHTFLVNLFYTIWCADEPFKVITLI